MVSLRRANVPVRLHQAADRVGLAPPFLLDRLLEASEVGELGGVGQRLPKERPESVPQGPQSRAMGFRPLPRHVPAPERHAREPRRTCTAAEEKPIWISRGARGPSGFVHSLLAARR